MGNNQPKRELHVQKYDPEKNIIWSPAHGTIMIDQVCTVEIVLHFNQSNFSRSFSSLEDEHHVKYFLFSRSFPSKIEEKIPQMHILSCENVKTHPWRFILKANIRLSKPQQSIEEIDKLITQAQEIVIDIPCTDIQLYLYTAKEGQSLQVKGIVCTDHEAETNEMMTQWEMFRKELDELS
jgi:hypothetical protein